MAENKSEGDKTCVDQSIKSDAQEVNKNKLHGVKRYIGPIEEVKTYKDGWVYKVSKCGNLFTGNITIPLGKGNKDWMTKARTESDLPMEIIKKYRHTCVTDEELFSILGDEFTLYYGFVRESSVNSGIMEVLAESFESLHRGGVMVENIDVFNGNLPYSRIVKFKWNGIVVHEEEGSLNVSFKKTNEAGRLALISKLGQHYYTVRAKKSFFNKGLPPRCQDLDKLNEIQRVVKKTDLPSTATMVEVKKFIDDFFQENPHLELLFGPDSIETSFFEPIKKYATEKDLGVRFFKSSADVKRPDVIVVFIKQSPVEVRERLKKLPDQQDLKFYLIPPSEQGKNYQDWCNEWVQTHVPDELTGPTGPPHKKRKLDK